MSRAKAFISILMVLILIALSGASVWAAPGGQQEEPTTIIGVVEEIDFDEETNTVLVTLVDELGETHKLSMSLEKAIELELVDENGDPIVNIGEDVVEIPLGDGVQVIEEAEHPVASALASAFVELFADAAGLDYETIMEYHEKGNGFGLIAQACWMSVALEGNPSLFGDILDAKKKHDFSTIELPEGVETPKNWGQFRKVVLGSEKAKNLGAIMSQAGKEQDETGGDELGATANQGQGKGKKGKGLGEEGGGPPAEPPGKGKGKGKGGGKPDTPPGQDKGGGKGKGGG